MALGANELFQTNDVGDRSQRVEAHAVQVKEFAVGTLADELPILTPVAYNTALNKWVPWVSGGANGSGTIRGLLWGNPVVLSDTVEKLGQVMLAGKVHYDAIAAAVAERNVETANNLKTGLRSGPRDLGIFVYGLEQVR